MLKRLKLVGQCGVLLVVRWVEVRLAIPTQREIRTGRALKKGHDLEAALQWGVLWAGFEATSDYV